MKSMSACLIECVLCGTTDPLGITRDSVATILRRSVRLRALLESQRKIVDGQVGFEPAADRVTAVIRKLAAGHAAYELARANLGEPTSTLLRSPRVNVTGAARAVECAADRGALRGGRFPLYAAYGGHAARRGRYERNPRTVGMLLNDWVEVQSARYRYLAAESVDGVLVRLVIAEYLAAEVWWADDDGE